MGVGSTIEQENSSMYPKRIKPASLGLKRLNNNCHNKHLNCGERLFVAIVKQGIKDKATYFLYEGECLERLADVLGVSGKTCDYIRINVKKNHLKSFSDIPYFNCKGARP